MFALIGGVLLSLVAIQLAVTVWSSLDHAKEQRASDRRRRELLDKRIEAQRKVLLEREEMKLAWYGYRKFVVEHRVTEADDICSFYLTPHDGKRLPRYHPGQHLTFRLSIPGHSKPVVRCYSLSDCASNAGDRYRVTIKRVPGSPLKPEGGVASTFFHQRIHVGQLLDVGSPKGDFYLDVSSHRTAVFIAGGVGITPVFAMLREIIRSGVDRAAWLLYGVRNGKQFAFREDLRRIASECPNVRIRIFFSDPLPEDELGRDYDVRGHITREFLDRELPGTKADHEFYVCGPPRMMELIKHSLWELEVPEERVRWEAFGPPTKKVVPPVSPIPPSGATIEFRKSGKSIAWDDRYDSILEAAEANGIEIDSGCGVGNCGSCEIALHSGKVLNPKGPPSREPAQGNCLACCSAPEGDLVLDA